MMIVVLGIGGVFGWVAQRAHVQRDAVAAITTLRRNTRGNVDKAEVLWVEQVRTLDDLAEGVALMRRHEISDEN